MTVNSVTINSPTSVTVNISTVNAIGGLKSITITNPDGQSSTSTGMLNVLGGPAMAIDVPASGAAAGQPLVVRGWAVDTAVTSGSGIDAVHVYVTPAGGAPLFLGAAQYGTSRPDVAQTTARSSHSADSRCGPSTVLAPGAYTITAYGHSAASGTFNVSHAVAVTLKAPVAPVGAVDTPADNVTVAGELGVTGWAVDEAGIRDVNIYRSPLPAEGTDLVFIGQAVFSQGRAAGCAGGVSGASRQRHRRLGLHGPDEHAARTGERHASPLHAYTTNYAGQTTLLGSRRSPRPTSTSTDAFRINRHTAGRGGRCRGCVVNFGWALAKPGRTIPIDGSTDRRLRRQRPGRASDVQQFPLRTSPRCSPGWRTRTARWACTCWIRAR